MEASVVKLIAFVAQQQMVAQDLGVVNLIFQLDNMRTQLLDLALHLFQAGADLGAALALLLAVCLLFGSVLGLLLFLGFTGVTVLQGGKLG